MRADVRANQTAVERPPFELLATGETLLMRIYTCPPCPFEGFDSIAGLILQGGELKTSGRATFQRAACHRATKEAKTGRHAQIKGSKIWQSTYYTLINQIILRLAKNNLNMVDRSLISTRSEWNRGNHIFGTKMGGKSPVLQLFL